MIAYLRVSTQKQGFRGLGIDAQRATIASYAARKGEQIDAEFIEVETGTSKRDRPVLEQALLAAKRLDTYLVTAKLDRLARSVQTVCAIQRSGVRFVALDLPESENPLFLYIIAALAEYEAKLISERTRAALAAKRAKGWRPTPGQFPKFSGALGGRVRWAKSLARDQKAAAYAQLLRDNGLSFRDVAQRLNDEGYTAPGGGRVHDKTVIRMLRRRREAQVTQPGDGDILTSRRRARVEKNRELARKSGVNTLTPDPREILYATAADRSTNDGTQARTEREA